MPLHEGPQPLGSVLTSLIDEMGIRPRLSKARVVETWAFLAGPQINGVTDSAWVRDAKLFVKITSSAWRQELHMRRRDWRRRLNQELGEELIEEIVFR